MSIPALVPEQDRAPSLASRVVTIHATDVTEGAPAPDSVTFALPCALRVPGDDVILRPGGVRVRLVDGRARVRLPVYGGGAVRVDGSDDWLIKVSPSWGGEYGIRVPAGSGEVSLADLPAVRPLTRREKAYAITGVGVTVTEGAHAGGTAEYRNGQIDLQIQVPSFRPETVYPYIDETADARAQHYEQQVRADLDDRLAEVTTAYELAVVQGYEGTLDEWLDSLVGPKGDQGDDSTVPGPPNVLTIGDVVTGDAGSEASATITGTSPEQVLGFTIPRGDKGDQGDASTVPGPTGKTAYEYAVEAGFTGTEAEFADAQLPDTISWENVDGKPAEYPPQDHSHAWSDITDPPADYPPAQHTHVWSEVTDKPTEYAPEAHTHPTGDVTGLDARIPARAWHGSVQVPLNDGVGDAYVQFPAGTFTATPLIQLTKQTGRAARHIPYLTEQSAGGFIAGLFDPTGIAATTENIQLAIYAYQP